jgi:Ribbon-helix-helix protein, copG family
MTTTVKLPIPLEDSLRERCSAEGRSISEVMRDALVMYLATAPKGVASSYALGQDLFGRSYGQAGLGQAGLGQAGLGQAGMGLAGMGLADLASNRKAYAASVWDEVAAQKMPGAAR